ncbi:bifunctional DNA-formamidopyrimidine glycosylase/DNA-(apurinic or apyrimidinic site) lyase [Acinetobacter qingfengensis]|uniref:Formamidopyrimidine-DNA glycosylase n=1 Tax=Acinetobacter qingfengensis TaxID=1262585 RepID=A0A1E7RFM3_9GAMM|nr:bifunctional DNA-formamidopyrimidine glycosylase/DNA-(apurinic or apyrimidinic site) lyase [Acinetobacter qingfengensis]KAA8732784.1 bifunctional DNA-formamidopyrimidine glycosylase/DNA-(apurinic or apyrimidinic site) lyase [Acinetobacter qingfengensis]OEY98103.1 DNA-formamidopyrimidine glycosylase [Acinetobacter qingfengensis]
MPELPEVETTKLSLQPLIHQKVKNIVVRNASLRWTVPDDLILLCGLTLNQLQRRSKYIIASFGDKKMLWHLGMSGSFRICDPKEELRKHDHVIFDFGKQQLRYHDPRRFGCLLWLDQNTQKKLLDPLGPEPLSKDFNTEYLQQKLHHKQSAIKVALMDNHVVVGVGNIYATESLFNCGIHPAQTASSLSSSQVAQLVNEIKRILQQAIQLGGSTLRDYSNAMGENGYFQQTLLAYGRAGEMCVNCETTLQNIKLGQRASVFCPQCQPLKNNIPSKIKPRKCK